MKVYSNYEKYNLGSRLSKKEKRKEVSLKLDCNCQRIYMNKIDDFF
jgi:hypothetical protein